MNFYMGFDMFSLMFTIIFALVIIMFFAIAVRGIRQWNKNNHAPRLTVEAMVVGKRENVTHHHHNHGTNVAHTTYDTTYYATFQVESGDRLELQVNGSEYGMLVEGDRGRLTFQGTRYLGFARGNYPH